MKDEIKEILDDLGNKESYINDETILTFDEAKDILDYITNLQEKSNNQTEEINRLYKQREKFMKKYNYLKEENERLKQLCDKYEEEHNTTFNEWKETITDKYQTLKELQQKNERLKKELNALRISEEEWLNETLGGDEEC
jgi:Mg2+ and Co2+ transporter CorA